jgi:hypothetical protein
MMYPYMTWNDDTEFVHSGVLYDTDNNKYVKVYVETPAFGGFKNAWFYLPQKEWKDICGFDDLELERFTSFLERNAPLIAEVAETGGVLSADHL